MIKIFKFLVKTYLVGAGILVGLALFDKFAGKLLVLLDPNFKNLLLAKLKKQDVQTTKEEIIHVLKPATSNGVADPKQVIS